MRDEPVILGIAVAGSAVYGFATVAAAEVIGRVTDRVVVPAFRDGETTTGALALAALAIMVTSLVKAAGIVVRRYFAGLGQYRLNARYRRAVSRQYLRLPLSWHHQHSTGKLLSNANADVEASFWPIAPLPFALGVVVMLVFALVSMFLADPWLALVGALLFPAILLLNFVYQRRLSPLATRAQALRAELSGVAHESFDGATVVKALGREAAETLRFGKVAGQLRDANAAVGRVRGAFDPMLDALPNLGVLAVLIIGSVRVADGSLPAGTLVQVAYLLTITAFPIRAIGFVLGELPRATVGWRRVQAVLDATGALPHGTARLTASGDGAAHLGLDDVGYSYVEGTPVLDGVHLDVEPGRTVAVVGSTGSGKSTLASLLVRLVDPVSGAVLLDGTDLRQLEPGQVAGAVSLVFQQPFIFEDSVRDNVTLGLPAPDDDVWAALRLAQGDRFVHELDGELDARIGERGATLSGGQRQRLALARALVRKPRLLVLDDATSAVDPEVERRILAGLRDAALPSTVVVVAYRRATIALADEVVYVEDGRVSARGTHTELLTTSPGYRDLITAYERDAAERAMARTDQENRS
ncbi:ABC transporter ATP-binding protein [Jiangella aurantiaca]|uniref:ABC transporter ATP-binding protein n=1 Tax=Jiangella aurantiaca TaxID=2530373 RepID=A0A4R5ABU6_9ACTN|nr:ABC transporter ATP-binding protein [Jiangella aurantiaca]TDD69671.1 ABC transporter ATP-binding protein [Jiangella aurantiaca]